MSDDERTLSWEGEGVGGMLSSLSGKRRSIELADILEVVVGHEGALFRDGEESSGQANLALSLILMPSLPEAPESGDGGHRGSVMPRSEERAALDLAFTDDEQFGLWLVPLRVMLYPCHATPSPVIPCPFLPLSCRAPG